MDSSQEPATIIPPPAGMPEGNGGVDLPPAPTAFEPSLLPEIPKPERPSWVEIVRPPVPPVPMLPPLPREPKVWLSYTSFLGDQNNGAALAQALGCATPDVVLTGAQSSYLLDNGCVCKPISQVDAGDSIGITTATMPDIFIDASHNDVFLRFSGYFPKPDMPDWRRIFRVKVSTPDAPFEPEDARGANQIFAFSHQFTEESPPPHDPRLNVLNSIPTRVTPARLAQEKADWDDVLRVDGYAHPLHVVVLGERLDNDDNARLRDAQKLGEQLGALVARYGGTVVITTSKRTQQVDETLRLACAALPESARGYIYPYAEGSESPYLALLAHADHVIATDDSMSIVSDALATPATRSIFMREASVKNDGNGVMQRRYAEEMLARGDFYDLGALIANASPVLPQSPPSKNSAEEMAVAVRTAYKKVGQGLAV